MTWQTGQTISLSDFVGFIQLYGGASAPTGWLLCDGSAVSRVTYPALFALLGTKYGAGDGSTTFNVPDLRSSVPVGFGQKIKTFTFDGASAVDPSTDQITVASNDFLHTGTAVVLSGTSLPTGLSAGTYYVIRVSATIIKLASTVANAVDGTAINITADGSDTCTLTLTFTSRDRGDQGGQEAVALTVSQIPSHSHAGAVGGGGSSGSSPEGGNDANISGGSTGGSGAHNNMPPYVTVNYIIKF
jgi:microcystin-dependent protein